ncbi:MAG: ABC transporter substrate-binding protein [Actinomycetota bacterium]|nr:ABC transporter substrate-binding protein [Actinomycetota bacterium]
MADRKLLRVVAVAGAIAVVAAGCAKSGNNTKTAGKNVGALKIGTLLPATGSLAFLGPPEIAGVQLAIKDINAAGGVNGKPVTLTQGDSGDTSTNIASQTVTRELNENVSAIVGAASSAVSLKVIDKITGAGVIQISPANTSDKLTAYPDKGLYFRTAPPDLLQAQALSELVLSDGGSKLGILALDDPYGTGLAKNTEKDFTDGGGQVVKKIIYDPQATSFRTEVAQIKAAKPDAVAVIGFDESAKIIQTMNEQGIGPKNGMHVYGVDGNMGNALGEKFKEPGALAGMKGTTPLTKLGEDFKARIKAVDPKLVDFNYAGESYDAVLIVALAAEEAKSNKGTDIAKHMIDVTKDGTKCTSYKDCKKIIDKGGNPDYDGNIGPISFVAAGEPGEGSYGILQFGKDNKIDDSKTEYKIVKGK